MEYPFKDLLPLDEVLEREGYYKDWTHLDPKVFYSLTQISKYIKTKGFGVDVRLLIAQLAEHFSLKTSQINEIERLFKDVMKELSEDKDFYSLPEIAGARGGFNTLGERFNDTAAQLAQTATKSEVESKIGELGAVATFKGSATNAVILAKTGMAIGDEWYDTTNQQSLRWNGTAWVTVGGSVKLGDGAVTGSKIARDSVTYEKVDFVQQSSNLYDESRNRYNFGIQSSTGGIISVANHKTNGQFIEVEPEGTIFIKGVSAFGEYSEIGSFIKHTAITNELEVKNGVTQKVSSKTYKIMASQVYSTYGDMPMQINNSDIEIPYEEYDAKIIGLKLGMDGVEPEDTNFIKKTTNLYDESKNVYDKGISSSNGQLIDIANHKTNGQFIEVEPFKTIAIKGISTVSEYTENGSFIRSLNNILGTNVTEGTTHLPSANTRKVMVSQLYDVYGDMPMQVNLGREVLPYEKYKDFVYYLDDVKLGPDGVRPEDTSFVKTTTNLYDESKNVYDKGISSSNGQLIDIANHKTNGQFIEVEPNSDLSLKGIDSLAEYDKDFNFLKIRNNLAGSEVTDGVNHTTGNLSKFVKASQVYSRYGDMPMQINLGREVLPYEEFGYLFPNLILEENEVGTEPKYVLDTDITGTYNTNEIYPDYSSWNDTHPSILYQMFDSLQTEFPDYITKQELRPASSLEVSAYHFKPNRTLMTNAKELIKVFITVGTHGFEKSTFLSAYNFLKNICRDWRGDKSLEALRFNVEFIIIPCVNPWSWLNHYRTNANGVDINRNFPDNFVSGTKTDFWSTYGGPSPLSEIESQNVAQIFSENPDIDIFFDYHNFNSEFPAEQRFIWSATNNPRTEQITEALVKKMNRKWSDELPLVELGDLDTTGYSSFMASGTIHNFATKTHGVKISATFETSARWVSVDEFGGRSGEAHTQDVVKSGTEALANMVILSVKNIADGERV